MQWETAQLRNVTHNESDHLRIGVGHVLYGAAPLIMTIWSQTALYPHRIGPRWRVIHQKCVNTFYGFVFGVVSKRFSCNL